MFSILMPARTSVLRIHDIALLINLIEWVNSKMAWAVFITARELASIPYWCTILSISWTYKLNPIVCVYTLLNKTNNFVNKSVACLPGDLKGILAYSMAVVYMLHLIVKKRLKLLKKLYLNIMDKNASLSLNCVCNWAENSRI